MNQVPYATLPDHCFWKRSVSSIDPSAVDPVVSTPFLISKEDKVGTAGSCFAQHISRYLKNSGFGYYVTETAHPLINERLSSLYNYGTYSARYGNIYTVRQLLQMFKRAYGLFTPIDRVWKGGVSSYIDPFRPQIQPGGFSSLREFEFDQLQHFSATRDLFSSLNVFVFTLGLTEGWVCRADGAVYPLCPGVAGGNFDPDMYKMHNFSVSEVIDDLKEFISLLRSVNKDSRVILTVSPVPLVATAHSDRHVLVATTYSKSVLRVACEEICRTMDMVAYFPSYEIILGNYSRGAYFADDCRSVLESGVSHVMRVFLGHFALVDHERDMNVADVDNQRLNSSESHIQEMKRLVQVTCDEEAIK